VANGLLSAGVDTTEHDIKEKLVYSVKYWGLMKGRII
jgi:hypothetical protein